MHLKRWDVLNVFVACQAGKVAVKLLRAAVIDVDKDSESYQEACRVLLRKRECASPVVSEKLKRITCSN